MYPHTFWRNPSSFLPPRGFVISLLLASLYASSALGEIVMVTDAGFPGGANNVTRDLGTGLDWLDWTASVNITFNAMTPLLGTTYQGWSHASQAQVITLLSNFGVPTANYPIRTNVTDGGASALSFISFIGATCCVSPTFSSTLGQTSDESPGLPGAAASVIVKRSRDISRSRHMPTSKGGSGSPFRGHALVRATPVPEPSTSLLAAFGALGLLGLRCRR